MQDNSKQQINKDELLFYKPLKIWLSRNIECYSNEEKPLNIDSRGYISIKGKRHNIFKIALLLFKKEPIRTGQIKIEKNMCLNIDALSYSNIKPIEAPKYSDLMKCIKSVYKEVVFDIGSKTMLFKHYIFQLSRNIEFDRKSKEYNLFAYYLQNKVSIQKSCIKNGFTVITGSSVINKHLNAIVEFYLKK